MISRVQRDFDEATVLLKRYKYWDKTTTEGIQLARLREVWCDCTKNIPYYKSLVASGKAPLELRSWEDFRKIPELTREILQDRPGDFIRHSAPPDLHRMTGGSTGNPIHFGVWHTEDRLMRLLKLTLWIRAGYRPGDRLFLIWGHSHLLGTGWRGRLNHVRRALKDRILGYRRVDAYRLDPARNRAYCDSLLDFRPAGLIGYAAALDSFTRANADRINDIKALGLRFVMPCSEPAPKPDTYQLLREVYGCPIVQEFGGVDFGQIASKFDDEPFSVFQDHYIVETTPCSMEREGDEAVLVTALYRRYLPLIRYRQGDAITNIERNGCGHVRSFGVLRGRIHDMFRLASGVEVHSMAIFHCIHQEPSILNIQMVLEDAGPRLSLATLDSGIAPEVESRVRHRLGQISSELAGIPIESVADIETTRAGKRRWFVDNRSSVASGVNQ